MKRRKLIVLLPALFVAMCAAVILIPVLLILCGSLMSSAEISGAYTMVNEYIKLRFIPNTVTIEQYYTVFMEKYQYLYVFWNSMRMTVPIVLGQVFFGSLAAYALSCFEFRGRNVIFCVYIAVMLMPTQATVVPNFIMVRRLGLLNQFSSVIFPGVFGAFGVVLLRQFMVAVPREYIEAARAEGAGYFRILFRIVLPLVKGGVMSVMILSFVDNWAMVELPLVFLSDVTMYPLSIHLSAGSAAAGAEVFAASVLAMGPPLLLFLCGREELVQGIELSGLK